jgi:hypothetical protein
MAWSNHYPSLVSRCIRGHVRTILGKNNVIVTRGEVRAMTLSHLTCIERP